jgi:glycogen debranching enzyme
MLTLRDFHALSRRDEVESLTAAQAGALTADQAVTLVAAVGAPPTIARTTDAATVRRPAAAVTLRCPGARFLGHAEWWYAVYYPLDHERGQDDHEDYYLPGHFEVELDPAGETEVALTVALGDHAAPPCDAGVAARGEHLEKIAQYLAPRIAAKPQAAGAKTQAAGAKTQAAAHADPALARLLALASEDFIDDRSFRAERLATVIAGYPWFADWGRDTFIALPGLLLATGRFDDARSCLKTFAHAIRDGLVPNLFNDYDDTAAQYNTVDASLWFIHAAVEYMKASGDAASWRDWLGAACVSIIEAYVKGTGAEGPRDQGAKGKKDSPPSVPGSLGPSAPSLIRMAGDGLITAGNLHTQLTWMDAASGGVVFTPRCGKAVEINALWYHVLVAMTEMLGKHEPIDRARAQHYEKLAGRITRSFAKVFWDDERHHLIDHVWTDAAGVEHRDASLRPNQLLAVSLANSPIPRTRQVEVLAAVKKSLLTPYGLRTLPEDDPKFHPRYTGPQMQRDEAYHQGTIWPWLIGPYAEAVLRVGKFSPAAKAEARAALAPLVDFMRSQALGQLPEIFEAEDPHRAVGCMAQGWSVAEVVRVMGMC